MKIKNYTILGERCSGTNFLMQAITTNFDIYFTWEYGHKHFFGFSDYANSDNTLFIGIVRESTKWLNSIFRNKFHFQDKMRGSVFNFLNSECWSYVDFDPKKADIKPKKNKDIYDIRNMNALKNNNSGVLVQDQEILQDRHIYTNNRYKNIFELRKIKSHFLLYDMPKLVKNYMLIRYEDLNDNYDLMLSFIQRKYCLKPKFNDFKPIKYYKNSNNKSYRYVKFRRKWLKKNQNIVSCNQVYRHPDFDDTIEKALGYIQYPFIINV